MDKTFAVRADDGSMPRKKLIEQTDTTFAEQVIALPPLPLLSDNGGEYARMRVDVGSSGFFAGREFRTFKEFNLAGGASVVYRYSTAVPLIVNFTHGQAWSGDCRIEIISEGGTQGGTFNVAVPSLRTNRMPTADLDYTSQVTVTTGGTLTGGTAAEISQLYSGSGSGRHHEITSDMRPYGLPAGVFYVKVTALGGAATGAINMRWEERP